MILCDYREKKVIEILKELGVEVETSKLELGDFIVGNIVIERKSADDFISSIIDRRLNNQILNLTFNFDKVIIAVTGDFELAIAKRDITPSIIPAGLASAIVRVENGKSLNVLYFESDYHFALFLKKLDEKYKEPMREFEVHKIKIPEGKEPIYVLASIPGLGPKKAESILKKFETLKNVANASVEELTEVQGVGEKLATKIFQIFNKNTNLRNKKG